ncbi:class I SAM-dependent methyltransferase [Thalassolituus sp. LLYu03]|uniref:class I SAM-dependent methyltransferase n=1 Tax=Thalassolituus sp. LLYu03 TaxID=3421656 RepID=UPI003D2A3CAB
MSDVLICLDDALADVASDWCQRFGLTLAPADTLSQPGFFLCLDASGLSLRSGDNPRSAVQVNFSEGAVAHRRKFGGGLGQDIAKAIGVTGPYKPSVVDATAGLGRDSFVLATLGCRVYAQERNPLVAALLADGLARGAQDHDIADILARISLTYGSSHDLLVPAADEAAKPDIVYLDPMFDHDPKQTALVKKDMQAFRDVVGQDTDADDLLDRALACARCRVVVKRARKAEPLAGRKPTYDLTGKSNRFDVYVKAKVAPLSDR